MKKVLSLMVCSLMAIGLVGCGEQDAGRNGDANGIGGEENGGTLDENGGAIEEESADQLPGRNEDE